MKIKLKVCGMKEAANIAEVSALMPDFMGFIFYPKSPRYVGDNFRVPEVLTPATKRVGVFVNATTDAIRRAVADCKLDFVQLHGSESVAQCRQIAEEGVGVIKVFSVDDEMDFSVTDPYHEVVDYFLFDTKGKLYGGNAKRFNWDVLSRYDHRTPFFLSGGIDATHIDDVKAMKGYNLVALDINSGVELRPGYKDARKISAIQDMLKH